MARPFMFIQAPVATRSGYGAHARDIVRSLIKMDKFDIQIGENPYITGEYFTVADITAFCATRFALNVCKIEIPPSCKNFIRWYKSVSSRSSIKNQP